MGAESGHHEMTESDSTIHRFVTSERQVRLSKMGDYGVRLNASSNVLSVLPIDTSAPAKGIRTFNLANAEIQIFYNMPYSFVSIKRHVVSGVIRVS